MQTFHSKNNESVQKKTDNTVSTVLDKSSQSESLQRKADLANNATQREEAPRPNNTGMPDNLKSGIESLSGFSMDDVRVHYNSSKPATVQALAYTQGTDIHVAPGQEKHLPHEAWHVAQQMAGRVSPTTNINGMPVNDNASLEHEADVMGEKAVTQRKNAEHNEISDCCNLSSSAVQRNTNDVIKYITQSLGGINNNNIYDIDCTKKNLVKIWRNLVNQFMKNNPNEEGQEIYVRLKYKIQGEEVSTIIAISKDRKGYIVAHKANGIFSRLNQINLDINENSSIPFKGDHEESSNWENDAKSGKGDSASKLIAERGRFRCLESVNNDNTEINLGEATILLGQTRITMNIVVRPTDLFGSFDSVFKNFKQRRGSLPIENEDLIGAVCAEIFRQYNNVKGSEYFKFKHYNTKAYYNDKLQPHLML